MNIVHKYIFWETTKFFLVSVFFLSMVMFTEQSFLLTELFSTHNVSFVETLKIGSFIFPAIFMMTIPLSVLMASILAFNHFSVENEYVAMKSSGWSFLGLAKPIMLFSICCYLLTSFMIIYAMPWGNNSLRNTIYDIIQKRAFFDIKPNVFNRDFEDLVFIAKERESANHLKGIFASETSDNKTLKIIISKNGTIFSNPENKTLQMLMRDGYVHEISPDGETYRVLNFETYNLVMDMPKAKSLVEHVTQRNTEVSLQDVIQIILDGKMTGHEANWSKVVLSRKFSLPFACLIFGIVGASLGIGSARGGKAAGFITCGIATGAYYITTILVKRMGFHGVINAYISVWIPNFLFILLAFYIVYKVQSERPFTFFNWVFDQYKSFYEFLGSVRYKTFRKDRRANPRPISPASKKVKPKRTPA